MAGTRSRTLELSSPGSSESVEAWGGRDSSLGSPQQLGRWMGQTILLPVTAPAAGTGGQAGCYLHSMTSSLWGLRPCPWKVRSHSGLLVNHSSVSLTVEDFSFVQTSRKGASGTWGVGGYLVFLVTVVQDHSCLLLRLGSFSVFINTERSLKSSTAEHTCVNTMGVILGLMYFSFILCPSFC